MKLRLLALFMVIVACNETKTSSDSALHYLPKDAAIIVKATNLSALQDELRNSTLLQKLEIAEQYKVVQQKLRPLQRFNPTGNCLIGFYGMGKATFEYVVVADQTESLVDLEGLGNKTVETFTYQDRSITKYLLENIEVFAAKIGNKILLSSSLLLLENQIRVGTNTVPEPLKRLNTIADSTKAGNLFVNLKQFNNLVADQKKQVGNYNLERFGDWMAYDLSGDQQKLALTGVVVANDSMPNFINLFKNTNPLPNSVPSIAPANTTALFSFTFDDYERYFENQKSFLDRVQQIDTLFNSIEEVGMVHLNDNKVVTLHSYGANSLYEQLSKNVTGTTEYQGSEIYQLSKKDVLQPAFGAVISDFETHYFTLLQNTFVFSTQMTPLQTVVANYKNGATFGKTAAYRSAKANLANESSVLFMANKEGVARALTEDFAKQLATDFKKADFDNDIFAAQLVADQSFMHANIVASAIERELVGNSVSPLFTIELETDLASDPRFVTNHRTKKEEVVVQDQDNNLYLISTEGKILWKKQLEGRIQGDIHQVDIYKNGKLQLAFCTHNEFLVLDRNGDLVAPFHKKFEGGNLNGLAVFDYDNNRNYRFVVTQGRKVFMYNPNGDIVDGFTYSEAESDIIAPPEHFRMANKDYLVFKLANKVLKIRHRAGQDRIKVDRKIDFSDNGIFLYRNKFSLTDKKGVLHQVDSKGKLSAINYNLGADHGMYATSKTLVLMNESTLTIKGKKVDLELGVYSAPKIFYINDKIYVAVTDLQNRLIYLYDSQAQPIPNFPVYGNSLIDMVDMDDDGKLEIVAKDQDNSIIVYRLN